MINFKIIEFGGEVNPINNSIQLFVLGELSIEIENHKLTKSVKIFIPESQTQIYNLCYQLQPLVYQFCEREFLGDSSNNPQ